jgi:hypothetical protein
VSMSKKEFDRLRRGEYLVRDANTYLVRLSYADQTQSL